jgi:multidrug efflux pump subunit AcrA (membrane-fusion protein)
MSFINKKTVGGFFFAILIILIFFSRTIYSHNLPTVTGVRPENRRLNRLEITRGVSQFAEIDHTFAAVGGTVLEVLAAEGDYVVEGQELLRLEFDRADAERRLAELANSRSRLEINRQNINIRLERLNRNVALLEAEVYTQDFVSTYNLDLLEINIRQAQRDLDELRRRRDDGEDVSTQIANARTGLDRLYLQLDEEERRFREQQERGAQSVIDRQSDRERRLRDFELDRIGILNDLQLNSIELANLASQEEPFRRTLEEFDAHAVITAPVSGTLISLTGVMGDVIREGAQIASIGSGGQFIIECTIPLENNFVIPGDTVELTNATHVIRGTVTNLVSGAQNKAVIISFESQHASAGETFDVRFEKFTDTIYTVVPNGALNQDNDGYFLNQIKRRDGMLGQEFFLERLNVQIGDSDRNGTAIIGGMRFLEPIALLSDRPVSPGDVIALENAGDFFER